MRTSAAARHLCTKFISTFFAATLALGLIPVAALATENSDSANAPTDNRVISTEASESERSEEISLEDDFLDESVERGPAPVNGDDGIEDNVANSDKSNLFIPAVSERINQDMILQTRTVAQAESTRSFFLAQTLESTRTVPIVSANLPLDTGNDSGAATEKGEEGSDDDSDGDSEPVGPSFSLDADDSEAATGGNGIAASSTVIGSFTYNGITYAVEPGGESVAVVAADYNQLPEEFIENQVIVLPSIATADDIDYYTVSRIADYAFANITSEAAIRVISTEASVSERSGEISTDEEATAEGDNDPIGIIAIAIPASVTSIGDDAFTGCDTLQYLIVSEDNFTYSHYDGALYNADQTCLLLIPEGRLGAVRIASGVEEISPKAFSHCASVDTLIADANSAAYQLLRGNDMYSKFLRRPNRAEAVNVMLSRLEDRIASLEGSVVPESVSLFEKGSRSVSGETTTDTLFGNGGMIHTTFGGIYYQKVGHTGPGIWSVNGNIVKYNRTVDGITKTIDTLTLQDRGPNTQFIGWSKGSANPSTAVIRQDFIKNSTDLYANWKVKLLWDPHGGWWDDDESAQEIRTSTEWKLVDHTSTMSLSEYTATSYDDATFPKRTGYTFKGWNADETAASGSTRVTIPNPITLKDAVYDVCEYAIWEAHRYTIDLDTNATNAAVSPQSIATIYDAETSLPTPTRQGYHFEGWNTDSNGEGDTYSAGEPTKLNLTSIDGGRATLYALWDPNVYSIVFDPGAAGGDRFVATDFATFNKEMPNLPASAFPEDNPGYRFTGYYDEDGVQYYGADGRPVVPKWDKPASSTLVAGWTEDTYRIDFVSRNPQAEQINHYYPTEPVGPVVDVLYKSSLQPYGSSSLVLSCIGYEFLGWSINEDAAGMDDTFLFNGQGEGIGTYEATGNTTLYSIWKPREVKVVWDANMVGSERVETTQTFGAPLKDVPTFSRFGYEPVGWYRSASGTGDTLNVMTPFRPGESDLAASEGIVYFMKWAPVSYEVTLYPGEHGSYAASVQDDPEVIADGAVHGGYKYVHRYTVEERTWEFEIPKSDAGYTFAGWQRFVDGEWIDCAGSVDAGSFQMGSKLVFCAKWTAAEAIVTLKLNGAPASEQLSGFSDTLTYSIEKRAILPTPVWAGHTFSGWKLVERGGIVVDPAEDIAYAQGETNEIPQNVVCEAYWETDIYTVRFLRSSIVPSEIAPAQLVGRDDAIVFETPAFREAFDVDRSNNTARIFKNYKLDRVTANTGTDVLFYPGDDPITMSDLLAAYPNLRDANGNEPSNGSEIFFYADWNSAYHVEVPLIASIAFDPELISEDPENALRTAEAPMRLLAPSDATPVEVVSLICEPTLSTTSAFDSNEVFYSHAYLTLSAKKRSAANSPSHESPVELNLGAAIANGSLSIHNVKDIQGETLSLPEAGFSFGGGEEGDRILDLTFGIRFDDLVDPSKLLFLNDPVFKDTGATVELANVYYTLAMKR